MIQKPIRRAASTLEDTDSDSNASACVFYSAALRVPLQYSLFEMAPDSAFSALIDFAVQLSNFEPAILEAISDDLTAHALAKKQQRVAHQRWIQEQTETLVDVPPEPQEAQPLQVGRPRMEPLVVLTFMLLRGSFGCSCKDKRFQGALLESISLRIFLENRGCSLPGGSTLEENLNAVSNITRERIHRAELALARQEELDDFKKIRGDSTAVNSASAYPTDSNTIAKLLCRVCSKLERLDRIGLGPSPLDELLIAWKTEIIQLRFRIDTIDSSSAKQSEKAAQKETQSVPQVDGDQEVTVKKESAKQRLRRELYCRLYALGEKILPELGAEMTRLADQIQAEKSPPREQDRRRRFIEEIEADLEAVSRGIKYSRERVCEGKKPSPRIGKMPWSVSDMSASFIEKGGWEKTFGYRPQLSFSASNLVTALIIPEGNAADQGQFIPLVKATIENTQVVPDVVSVDDGYTGGEQLSECRALGVRIVSFSGARGKMLLGEELWDSQPYQEARRARNGAESGISVLKGIEGFEQLSRTGIEGVRGEELEKVISYNALKIISLRKQKYEEEFKKKWSSGLPRANQEAA